MKIAPALIATTLCAASFIASCDDTTTTLGTSLVDANTEIVIDSSFTISAQSILNNDIPSRTVTQLLGTLDAKEFGSFSSDFVTQFMPAMQLDTTGVTLADIDSIKLLMFFRPGAYTGDSIVPMGLKVYPLTRQLQAPIYSDFDPTGYYDPSTCWTPSGHIYTGNALYNDSVNSLSFRTVTVNLPIQFAKDFYSEYLNNPATFATPAAFARFFPGIYVKTSFGSGRVINFDETRINLFYRRHAKVTKDGVERDTIYNLASTYMAVTPEVVSNNIIRMQLSQTLTDKANNGEAILVAPAGYDVRMEFPAQEIIDKYRADAGDMSVINTLTMSIPVEKIQNNYNINPPANVLLVLTKDKTAFFNDGKLTDDKTSFLGTYNATTSTYEFTGLRPYIINLIDKTTITPDEYTFSLTPVSVTTETSQSSYYTSGATYITAICPYVEGPAMCRLNTEKIKIKFTYSKQSIKN